MIVYATHKGGRYLNFADSLNEQPEGKRNLYVNLTNQCDCACVFCLRHKKHMAENSSLWLKHEPTAEEVKVALDDAPWEFVADIVFCGFGEPTMRLDTLLELLRYVREKFPTHKTRLNTNGLAELHWQKAVAPFFDGLLDTVSISLNASTAERYLELTRAKYGLSAFDGMLAFAEACKKYVPNVALTVVDKVENAEEVAACREICRRRNLNLRVREYEDS